MSAFKCRVFSRRPNANFVCAPLMHWHALWSVYLFIEYTLIYECKVFYVCTFPTYNIFLVLYLLRRGAVQGGTSTSHRKITLFELPYSAFFLAHRNWNHVTSILWLSWGSAWDTDASIFIVCFRCFLQIALTNRSFQTLMSQPVYYPKKMMMVRNLSSS